MKKVFFLVLFPLVISVMAQEADPKTLIEELHSDNLVISMSALMEIRARHFTQAENDILNLYDQQIASMQVLSIDALSSFGYPKVIEMAHEFIQNVEGYSIEKLSGTDPLEARVDVTDVLFYYKDYSTCDYVFDLIYRDGLNNIENPAFYLLLEVVFFVPAREQEAKSLIETLWQTHPDEFIRYHSMETLSRRYGTEYDPQVLSVFMHDPDHANRMKALGILIDHRYPDLDSILSNALSQETSASLRLLIADSLLCYYGTPENLHTVLNYGESDPKVSTILEYDIKNFIPAKPESNVKAEEMIKNFQNYVSQMIEFGWINNPQCDFTKEAQNLSDQYITHGDTGEAMEILSDIIECAADCYEQNTITMYAYKFLYYYPEYIRAKILEE